MKTGLESKTVIVTGASGGIGSTVATTFAEEGANVVLHYFRNRGRAEQVAEQIPDERSLCVGADLRDEAQVAALFEQVVNRFGVPHVLVANAGLWPANHTPFYEMTLQQWNETLAANLTSAFLCAKHFCNRIRNSGIDDPSIVLVGSTAGQLGEAGHADYAAAKSGVMQGLMLSLKNEIVQIAVRGRVNAVCPGWTITPMTEKFADDPSAMNKALATIAMNKVGRPLDIASAIVFLASPRLSGHVSGHALFVHGGMEGRLLNDL